MIKREEIFCLIEDKFLVKVYRNDRQDDSNTINGKASEITLTTLENLFKEGLQDANKWFKEEDKKKNSF